MSEKKWFHCPVCGQKLAKTNEQASGGVFIKCKKCKQDVEIKHQYED